MTGYISPYKKLYDEQLVSSLQEKLGLENRMEVPKILKIVVSMTDKDAVADAKVIERAAEELLLITGQKPVITKAKKAIASFKLRQGSPIGCKVTLRKNMMYDFLYRLVNIALPRVKDFRGLSSKKFDGNGNYAIGLKEHLIFPEINYDKIEKLRGMNIVIVTTAKSNEHAMELLKLFSLPIKD